VESWRFEKLKDIKSASIQNSTKLDLSNEEARTLKRALQFNWHVLLEDIGLWIPSEVSHTEHDDKPENEPEGLFFVFIYEVQSIHGLSSNNCVLFTFVVVVIDYILKFSK
jgi:hypothetical protein